MRRIGWRVGLGYTLVLVLVTVASGATAFQGMLELEDAVIAEVMSQVIACGDERGHASLACLGATSNLPPGATGPGFHDLGEADWWVDARGTTGISTGRFEVFDPVEALYRTALGLSVALVCVGGIGTSMVLTRWTLQPLNHLETILVERPLDELGAALAVTEFPDEFEGLRRRLGEALQRVDAANRRERLYSRYVSHELRTPLAVIRAALDLLDDPETRPAGQERARRRARDAVGEMENITTILLALSRKNLSLSRNEVSIDDLVDDELARLSPEASRRGVRLDREGRARAPLRLPETALRLVLRNLLSNAVRHGAPEHVRVRVGDTSVEVVDDGTGVAEEDLPRLLRPFETGSPDGYGIGLALVTDLVDREGWTLRLERSASGGLRAVVEFGRPP